jgi:hypothetical protein
MQKSMTAKYPGKCSISGARINKGDDIVFDTVTRKTWFSEPGDCQIAPTKSNYVSDILGINGVYALMRLVVDVVLLKTIT